MSKNWDIGEEIKAEGLNNQGLKVVAQDTPGLTLRVFPGVAIVDGTIVKYNGGNTGTISAPAANPRIDLITIDSAGTIGINAGAENASPSAPAYPSNKTVLAEVYCKVGMTQIVNVDATGKGYVYRDSRPLGAGISLIDTTTGSADAGKGIKTNAAGYLGNDFIDPVFGDGSDGDATISAPTTLTRDMYYNNLTINSTLNTDGYRVFVKGTISGSGTIYFPDGENGTDGQGGASNQGGTGGNGGNANNQARPLLNTPGAGGGGGGAYSLLGSGNASAGIGGIGGNGGVGGGRGGDGGTGNNTTGGQKGTGGTISARLGSTIAGVNVGNGSDGNNGSTGGSSRPGGQGGNGVDGQIGNNSATTGNNTASSKFGLTRVGVFTLAEITPTGLFMRRLAGAKAGNGGSSGSPDTSGSFAGRRGGPGGGGGGSGASGGIVWIAAHTWAGTFTIKAIGGNGGNGGAGLQSNSSGAGSQSGSGGDGGNGGPGGVSIVIYKVKTWTGSYNLAGGTKGTGGAAGAANGSATAGSNGANGTDGPTGISYEILVDNLI